MSEEDFHAHRAHENTVEHVTHHSPDLAQRVAVFTAILSTLGAIFSYQGGDTQNEALLYKNETVLKNSQASDQWNYYQAKSTKDHLIEFARDFSPANKKAEYEALIKKYAQKKEEIKQQAELLEAVSREANEQSEKALYPHHNLAQAMMLIQIAIPLASITILMRTRWLFAFAGFAATCGVDLWILAWAG
jgi:hypothetical protein